MAIEHVAGVGFWIAVVAAAASAQQPAPDVGPGPDAPAQSTVVRTYPTEGVLPSRQVVTRSGSGDRDVRTEIVETPDLDGRLRPSGEAITETIRSAPGVRTQRQLFTYPVPGQRRLLETIESEQELLADGSSRSTESTWAPDLDGRPGLTSRQIQQTTSAAPDVKQTDTVVFRRGTGGALEESERVQQTERQVGPDLRRTESTRSVRDMNSRFQLVEKRSHEVRTVGPSEEVEVETLHGFDLDSKPSLIEQTVIRRSTAGRQDQVVEETFSKDVGAVIRSDDRLELSQRVRRTTTTAADGGGETVEEVEARNRVSPGEPVRMIRRTVETIRKTSDGRWQTARQSFVVDVNGRWVLSTADIAEAIDR